MPTHILAIDSTTEACSAAVQSGADTVVRCQETARGHSAMLMGMIDAVLAEAGLARTDLDVVAFCRGPGSFTGVRIAAGVAQGLAMGLGVPTAPVSTLACIAQRAYRERGAEKVLAAIDARMGEVYWGAFRLGADGLMESAGPERVVTPEAVPLPAGDGWQGFGTGWCRYAETLTGRVGSRISGEPAALLPCAVDVLPLARRLSDVGDLVPPEQAQPVYLRDRVTS